MTSKPRASEGLESYRYVILGAGPAGLAFGASLLRGGETSFIILEKEDEAGGLCRSETVDGFPLDIAGCHLLDHSNAAATDFVFSFLPKEEWQLHERYNCVQIGEHRIGYPFESHIWQLPRAERERYLAAMRQAPARRGEARPDNLYDWAYWNFGDAMAEDYFIPYNEKIWSYDLKQIGTYWMHKLPPVSYEDVLESCEKGRSPGKFAAHKHFYYPKQHGFGEAFLCMANFLSGHIVYRCTVDRLDWRERVINGRYRAETVVNTTPWPAIDADFPNEIRREIAKLRCTGLDVTYHPGNPGTDSQAIYYPDRALPHHRAIFRSNYNAHWPGYWTETNALRNAPNMCEIQFHSDFAYPINTIEKPAALEALLRWGRENRILGLGRWGEWEYINCDVAICRALRLADSLLGS